jgi:hypothetical protein
MYCIYNCHSNVRIIKNKLTVFGMVTEKYLVPNSAATLVSVAEERSLSPASYSQAPVIVQTAYTNYRYVIYIDTSNKAVL